MATHDLRESVILVVDDEQANLDLLEACLAEEGYGRVTGLRDSREVIATCETLRPDVILLDLHMPWPDGFEILRLLGEWIPEEEYLPILVLTADVTEATKQRALSGGARDFLTKPLNISEVLLRLGNLLHTRSLHQRQTLARRVAEDGRRRATFLADASQVLASSFDQDTTLSVVCQTAVPRLADYCVVDVLHDDGTIRRIGAAHADTAKEPLLREIAPAATRDLAPVHPAHAALVEGKGTLLEEITPESLAAAAKGRESREILERLGPRSSVTVPLLASGHIHGVLELVQAESGRRFAVEDLELASELARRAALTIENARLYNHALEATRARDEMLAVVAHDLRNPLSTIRMGSTMLREEATSATQQQAADLVARAADRMNRLIEDLLDVTRIERGKLPIEPRPQTVSPVVKEAVAMLRPLADARQIALSGTLRGELPPVMMDSARILQVLSNLVGNALKFTPAGGKVEITVEEAAREVLFAVSDTGAGIPRDQIPHVFGRFWQATDRDTRGIGLGLSIVRGIVQGHGGRTWVESEQGRGATFYFTLNVAEREEERQDSGLRIQDSGVAVGGSA